MLEPADLLQPELVELKRLPMRAPLAFFDDHEAAVAGTRPRRRLSLDGEWRLQLVESADAVPTGWPATRPRVAEHRVAVPGCWTMQGVGDRPHYTNIIMPWAGLEPPQVPLVNPTGLYTTSFDVPQSWLADQIVIHLGGFESVAAVWCNGRFVGMGKDSRLASEFCLDQAVVAGPNQLDVMVIRYSDATWIEDQDHWWHGGLHRSVFVEARPRLRIDDVATVADFDPSTGVGSLAVTARTIGDRPCTVLATLYPGSSPPVADQRAVPAIPDGPPLDQLVAAYDYPGRVVTITLSDLDVAPWTAETPNLHDLIVELVDHDGQTTSAHRVRVGFRRLEVRERRFLVNGTPIVFHGVNRHDHHPDTGKVLTPGDLRDDLVAMKRHNINAVRCAHYPNDPRLLDLCDELGLWVVDEANVECHARLRSLSDDPRYRAAMVDRVVRMVTRDRNHPSVVMWSLGNEAGDGVAFDASAAAVRAIDPSRPLHYEGAVQRRFRVEGAETAEACVAPSDRERRLSDVVCPMYTSVEVIEAWAEWAESTGRDDRPLLLCEYSHSMGNSNGGFDRYAEAFHRMPALAGGFVWDWKDQGLRATDAQRREYWAYGGHFGDEPNDANFCINGLVAPDGTPHPGLAEIAWGYRPVAVTGAGEPTHIVIENRQSFVSTGDLDFGWKLVVDGNIVDRGAFSADIGPRLTEHVVLPIALGAIEGDVQLQVTAVTTRATAWAQSGTEVAFDEIVLSEPTDPCDYAPAGRTPQGETGPGGLAVDPAQPTWVTLDRRPVATRFAPTVWRAPRDDDGVAQGWMSEVAGQRPRWLRLGLDRTRHQIVDHGVDAAADDPGPTAWALHRLTGADEQSLDFLVAARLDGAATHIQIDVAPESGPETWTDLPRIGVRFEMPAEFDRLRWYGLGPHEAYPDRRASARTGIWSSTVEAQYHPFVVPQEHGAHAETRWLELAAASGRGLRFAFDRPCSFSARFQHDADLSAASTLAELRRRDTIEVHIDLAMRGLGTGACGPDVAPRYQVHATPMSLGIRLGAIGT